MYNPKLKVDFKFSPGPQSQVGPGPSWELRACGRTQANQDPARRSPTATEISVQQVPA